MKRRSSLFLCLALLALAGCNLLDDLQGSTSQEITAIEIHLQEYFGTPVRVVVDQQVVFEGDVIGGNFSGPAEVIALEVSAGSHDLVVTINGTLEAKTNFNPKDTQVVGVRYLREEAEVRFSFYTEMPLYM
jgi:hypothetical protein